MADSKLSTMGYLEINGMRYTSIGRIKIVERAFYHALLSSLTVRSGISYSSLDIARHEG